MKKNTLLLLGAAVAAYFLFGKKKNTDTGGQVYTELEPGDRPMPEQPLVVQTGGQVYTAGQDQTYYTIGDGGNQMQTEHFSY